MPSPARANQGPGSHRFLIRVLTVVLGVLIYWLLGFLMDDIGDWPGPNPIAFEQERLDATLVEKAQSLETRIAEATRRIQEERNRQGILRESTQTSQETMRQLLEIQRLALQKNVTPTADEQKALADSESLFLSNQKRSQEINEEITRLDESLRSLQDERRQLEARIESLRAPIRREFDEVRQRHDLRVALAKLAALAPVLLLASWLFLKYRSGQYAPLVYSFGAAVLLKIALVMHEYFPSRYFKYVLIFTCLAAVLKALVSLLQMIARPRRDWLLKQYREAYEAFFCPVCDFPIRRGPLKFLSWTRRTIRRLVPTITGTTEGETPYVCPSCGTQLFEECGVCHTIRHSLLPACCGCGAIQEPATTEPAGPTAEPPRPR